MKYKILLLTILLFVALTSCTARSDLSQSQTETAKSETTQISETSTAEVITTEETQAETTLTTKITSSTTEKLTSKITNTTKKKSTTKTTATEKVTELTYIQGVLIVNKTYALPENYNPGINETALNAYYELKNDAKSEGLSYTIISDFRPYSSQKRIYNNYVARDGKKEADRYSARPGHSEHQTGLAFDLNSLSQSFENTAEGKWLAENCYKYGFIIRYPKGKESVTGYMYEPWHIRYLGKDLAKEVYESGLTLEEFLGITSRYSD